MTVEDTFNHDRQVTQQDHSITDKKVSMGNTVIPRLTSDPANEDFFAVFGLG